MSSKMSVGLFDTDVDVCPSSLGSTAGKGVFARRSFQKGDFVTFYDGVLVSKSMVEVASRMKGDEATVHCWNISVHDYVICGLKSEFIGRGVGSFVNHSSEAANVRFNKEKSAPSGFSYITTVGITDDQRIPVVYMEATRNIEKDEEIFVNYGRMTCRRLGIPYGILEQDIEDPPEMLPELSSNDLNVDPDSYFLANRIATTGFAIVCPFDNLTILEQIGFDLNYLDKLRSEISSSGDPIFQHMLDRKSNPADFEADNGDCNRRQKFIQSIQSIREPLQLMEQHVKSYLDKFFNPDMYFDGQCLLVSCSPSTEAQDRHADRSVTDDQMSYLERCSANCVPLSVILAVGNDSTLRVWPGSHKVLRQISNPSVNCPNLSPIEMEVVKIPAWHMIVFRQDLVHAGDKYEGKIHNLRWFAFYHHHDLPPYEDFSQYTQPVSRYEEDMKKVFFLT